MHGHGRPQRRVHVRRERTQDVSTRTRLGDRPIRFDCGRHAQLRSADRVSRGLLHRVGRQSRRGRSADGFGRGSADRSHRAVRRDGAPTGSLRGRVARLRGSGQAGGVLESWSFTRCSTGRVGSHGSHGWFERRLLQLHSPPRRNRSNRHLDLHGGSGNLGAAQVARGCAARSDLRIRRRVRHARRCRRAHRTRVSSDAV